MTEDLKAKVLDFVDQAGSFDSFAFAKQHNVDHQVLVGLIKSLEVKHGLITKKGTFCVWLLTEDGEVILAEGSPEAVVFNFVKSNPREEGILVSEIESALPNVGKIGFNHCMRNKWISKKGKTAKGISVVSQVEEIDDKVKGMLQLVKAGELTDKKSLDLLKKRKLISRKDETTFAVSKGENFRREIADYVTDLTSEMLKTGEWAEKEFKPYNYNAMGKPVTSGYLHPLMKVRTEFCEVFLGMGFQEMKTNNFVESSFWNFDSLFQPQQHPSRDMHDTFFLTNPKSCSDANFDADHYLRVKEMHERGGHGSMGWRYTFSDEEPRKNILRTHTTAISSQVLYNLAKTGFKPGKYFSIDRVFRNESVDATHLAEFNQLEGFVCDYGLNLSHLIGIVTEFFRKVMGEKTKLRFKPAYNPYTEPSMEIFSWHEGLKKWVEIGNSGIFRPEMLRPMGLSEDVTVIAWGLSLERPTMIKYGINNIRELIGYKVDLNMIKASPICRLDK